MYERHFEEGHAAFEAVVGATDEESFSRRTEGSTSADDFERWIRMRAFERSSEFMRFMQIDLGAWKATRCRFVRPVVYDLVPVPRFPRPLISERPEVTKRDGVIIRKITAF